MLKNHQIIGSMLKNWGLVSHLIHSLFEIASRTRLAVCIPDIYQRYPLTFNNFHNFAPKMEKIEEWNALSREVVKKFGNPQSLCELSAATKKTVQSRRANSPYIKNILIENPRMYKYGRVLPNKLCDIFSTNKVLSAEFNNFIKGSLDFKSKANLEVLRETFPETLRITQIKIATDFGCFEYPEDLD